MVGPEGVFRRGYEEMDGRADDIIELEGYFMERGTVEPIALLVLGWDREVLLSPLLFGCLAGMENFLLSPLLFRFLPEMGEFH